jgi:hypothetical protein
VTPGGVDLLGVLAVLAGAALIVRSRPGRHVDGRDSATVSAA